MTSALPSVTVEEEEEEEAEHTARRGTSPAVTTTSDDQTLSKSLTRRRNSTGDMALYCSSAKRPVSGNQELDGSSNGTTATTSETTQTPSDSTSAELDWEDAAKEQKGSGGSNKGGGGETTRAVPQLADKGNCLSQIEVPAETDGNAMSVVNVLYDL